MFLLALIAICSASPPAQTLEMLGEALEALGDPAAVRSFTVTTLAVSSDEDESDRHEDLVVTELTSDGTEISSNNISVLHDGEPVSEKKKKKESEQELELTLPYGDDLAKYTFGVCETDSCSFEPASDAIDESMVSGIIKWDPESLAPKSLQLTHLKTPLMVKQLSTTIIIDSTGGKLHTSRIVSSGKAGLPGMRKSFQIKMEFAKVAWY